MPRELVNANITHVSYVDKGANKKQFFFTKSDDRKDTDFQKEVKVFINKDDEEQQLVYGVVYEPGNADDPDTWDSHDDFMTASEIEKSAHIFMKDARNIDKQHDFNAGVGEVVESYIAPTDFTLDAQEIKKGSWVLVTKATDEIWEDIKKGEITGYSMAGTAETVQKQNKKQNEKPVSKSNDDEEFKGFFNMLKSFFTKGEVRDNYESNQKRRNLWAAYDGMEQVFFGSLWDNPTPDVTDFDRLLEGVQEFAGILQEIKSSGDIQKVLENKPETIGKGESDMKKEDIEKLLDDKLNPITKRLDDIEKEEQGEDNTTSGNEDEDVMKQFSSMLDEKLSPITKRLETVEKARGVSNQADPDQQQIQQQEDVQKGYMRHFG